MEFEECSSPAPISLNFSSVNTWHFDSDLYIDEISTKLEHPPGNNRISNLWVSFICNVLGNRFVNYVSSTNLQGPSRQGECPKTSASLGQQFPGSLKITKLYFAILLNCTGNSSCVEQMTIIPRYTDMEKWYVGKSKIIHTFAITPFQVCHTDFCTCMHRVGTTVVTWSKFDLDRVIFLAAVTV
jgi:hypothetical protein